MATAIGGGVCRRIPLGTSRQPSVRHPIVHRRASRHATLQRDQQSRWGRRPLTLPPPRRPMAPAQAVHPAPAAIDRKMQILCPSFFQSCNCPQSRVSTAATGTACRLDELVGAGKDCKADCVITLKTLTMSSRVQYVPEPSCQRLSQLRPARGRLNPNPDRPDEASARQHHRKVLVTER